VEKTFTTEFATLSVLVSADVGAAAAAQTAVKNALKMITNGVIARRLRRKEAKFIGPKTMPTLR
jgi:hypothetical protein